MFRIDPRRIVREGFWHRGKLEVAEWHRPSERGLLGQLGLFTTRSTEGSSVGSEVDGRKEKATRSTTVSPLYYVPSTYYVPEKKVALPPGAFGGSPPGGLISWRSPYLGSPLAYGAVTVHGPRLIKSPEPNCVHATPAAFCRPADR